MEINSYDFTAMDTRITQRAQNFFALCVTLGFIAVKNHRCFCS